MANDYHSTQFGHIAHYVHSMFDEKFFAGDSFVALWFKTNNRYRISHIKNFHSSISIASRRAKIVIIVFVFDGHCITICLQNKYAMFLVQMLPFVFQCLTI